jgi:hydrogenase maturation protease
MAPLLILGCGNPLRGDDAVAWRAAELLADSLRDTDALVRTSHQLTPELAEAISQARQVIFLDADCGRRPGEVALRALKPASSLSELFTHQLTPERLLALAKRLYGRCPEAVLISVGAGSFDFGAALSPQVEAALPALLEKLHTTGGIGLLPSPGNS